jgi:hypothetical protein
MYDDHDGDDGGSVCGGDVFLSVTDKSNIGICGEASLVNVITKHTRKRT